MNYRVCCCVLVVIAVVLCFAILIVRQRGMKIVGGSCTHMCEDDVPTVIGVQYICSNDGTVSLLKIGKLKYTKRSGIPNDFAIGTGREANSHDVWFSEDTPHPDWKSRRMSSAFNKVDGYMIYVMMGGGVVEMAVHICALKAIKKYKKKDAYSDVMVYRTNSEFEENCNVREIDQESKFPISCFGSGVGEGIMMKGRGNRELMSAVFADVKRFMHGLLRKSPLVDDYTAPREHALYFLAREAAAPEGKSSYNFGAMKRTLTSDDCKSVHDALAPKLAIAEAARSPEYRKRRARQHRSFRIKIPKSSSEQGYIWPYGGSVKFCFKVQQINTDDEDEAILTNDDWIRLSFRQRGMCEEMGWYPIIVGFFKANDYEDLAEVFTEDDPKNGEYEIRLECTSQEPIRIETLIDDPEQVADAFYVTNVAKNDNIFIWQPSRMGIRGDRAVSIRECIAKGYVYEHPPGEQ